MSGHGAASGECIRYAIEARSYDKPVAHPCGMLLDQQWRGVEITGGAAGIPVGHDFGNAFANCRLLEYQVALALAHRFLAVGPYTTEVRLVEVRYTYSYDTAETGVGEAIHRRLTGRDASFTKRELPKEAGDE